MPGSGAGDVRELRKVKANPGPGVLSPDGKKVVFLKVKGGIEVQVLDLEGALADAEPAVLVDPRNDARVPSLSPDGRWMVYAPVAGGLYVQPCCTGPGPRRQITPEGYVPMWRRDGREILYRRGETVMAVSVEWSAQGPSFGTPREMIKGLRASAGQTLLSRPIAVSRDGPRIFYAQGVEQPEANVIQIKTGAFDGLR